MGRNSILELKFGLQRKSPAKDNSINRELSSDIDGILCLTRIQLLTSYSFQHRQSGEKEKSNAFAALSLHFWQMIVCFAFSLSRSPRTHAASRTWAIWRPGEGTEHSGSCFRSSLKLIMMLPVSSSSSNAPPTTLPPT